MVQCDDGVLAPQLAPLGTCCCYSQSLPAESVLVLDWATECSPCLTPSTITTGSQRVGSQQMLVPQIIRRESDMIYVNNCQREKLTPSKNVNVIALQSVGENDTRFLASAPVLK